MNVIQVLLVIGLIYIAMNQKSHTNRNLILVITGLLAFCMMGTEGLMVFGPSSTEGCDMVPGPGTCAVAGGKTNAACAGNTTKTTCDSASTPTAECVFTETAPATTCTVTTSASPVVASVNESCVPSASAPGTDCSTFSAGAATCPAGCTYTAPVTAAAEAQGLCSTSTGSGTCTYYATGSDRARTGTTADFSSLVSTCTSGTVIGGTACTANDGVTETTQTATVKTSGDTLCDRDWPWTTFNATTSECDFPDFTSEGLGTLLPNENSGPAFLRS